MTRKAETVNVVVGYDLDFSGNVVNAVTVPVEIDGFRLVDGRGSYGFGLESFILGFPMHFDFSWKTLFNRDWEDAIIRDCQQTAQLFATCAPSSDWQKMKFDFWIGYDF
jgi:hypothetical protein